MSERSVCKTGPNDRQLEYHLSLLKLESQEEQLEENSLAPVFTSHVLSRCCDQSPSKPAGEISQYGLLAGITKASVSDSEVLNDRSTWEKDPRLFFNVSSPSSTFICGSQGSGKSHTLSCILEGCLIPSKSGNLSSPLTAVVFHYDTFICDSGGSPCEAAFLASNSDIEIRVLCAPTNLRTIKGTYSRFNIKVEALKIDQADLNTKRMLDLMAVGHNNGPLPLYMHTVQRILREMRVEQQSRGTGFDYAGFKTRILVSGLTPGQLEPLKQRLDTLESFMPSKQAFPHIGAKVKAKRRGSDWTPRPSQLTIVDLSCPCISSDTACSLFNICLGIFLEQNTDVGRIVALDEAHKYMDSSVEARSFTESLLSAVRLQRHLGVRIVISTQEPTISTALLGLCSITVVHRFSSPEWLRVLKHHIAAVAIGEDVSRESSTHKECRSVSQKSLFDRIVRLRVGEALLFSPSAVIGTPAGSDMDGIVQKLGPGFLEVRVRSRLTEDGGRSVMA
ncbi:uncharacterized protein N7487_011875 [Penicillium crustosum]|uniref:uncharacterized protein n=1 Tax=Penicillium crustosum TaxID=36656 RepID=UPI002382AC15|nr:uncharacterized protein N7487_011875 [Penicillium crustosum]KAJ5394234.1 hypothetical protein N7487_011875 [Penicillium crustosum]